MQDRKDIIESNIGLVHSCVKRFKDRGIEYDDLFQSGCIGLIKAVDGFDKSKGFKFSTYAVPVIFGEIKGLFRDGGAIKVGRKLKDLSIKAKREYENFMSNYSRSPTINELAELLGLDVHQAVQALDASRSPVSLTVDEEGKLEQLDIPVEFDDEGISTRISLMESMRSFDLADKKLIYLRFFKGITQSQSAKILGMTQVKVSRRERTLLNIIRVRLS